MSKSKYTEHKSAAHYIYPDLYTTGHMVYKLSFGQVIIFAHIEGLSTSASIGIKYDQP